MSLSTRSKRWLVLATVVLAVFAGLRYWRDHITRMVFERVAELAVKGGYKATFQGVSLDIWEQHIHLTGLSIEPIEDRIDPDSASTFTIRASGIDLRGVDIRALLRQKVLHVGHVVIHAPEIRHTFRTLTEKRTKQAGPDAPTGPPAGLQLIHVDTLQIIDATGHSQDRGKAVPAMSVADLDLLLADIAITSDAQGKPHFDLGSARIAVHDAQAHVEPYYALRIDSMRVMVPEDSAVVFGLHFTPDVNAQEYHKHVKTQVELYKAKADTILLAGFDLAAKLDHGALMAGSLYIAGITVDIHRDKSLPLAHDRPRNPMLTERIQTWEVPVSLAHIDVTRGRVTYHERLKLGEPYGSLTLGSITAQLTGITNMRTDGVTALHLQGNARLWNKALAKLDLRTTRSNGPTQVEIKVLMRELPAKELNRMTDELVHVRATEGRIHLVDMHMKGDDVSARGTVAMHYEGLHLELSPELRHAGILSFVANTVVRTSNMPDTKGYRVGHFKVDRRQETSVFNYLWLGLREGMMDVMLPPAVLKKLKKQQRKGKSKK
jgi:hypothetical protein